MCRCCTTSNFFNFCNHFLFAGTGQNGTAAMVLRKWVDDTPAGKAAKLLLSPADYYIDQEGERGERGERGDRGESTTTPVDFWLLAGDVGMCSMHDGHHFPMGVESVFLDALSSMKETTHRYHRCSSCPSCSACPGSKWHEKRVGLLWVLGSRLIHGKDFEQTLPKVVTAEAAAATTLSSFVVRSAVLSAQRVTLWYSASTTRVYNNPEHAPWTSVMMVLDKNGDYVSPTIVVPNGEQVAWYVEAETTMPLLHFKKMINVTDSSPVRVQDERPPRSCPVPVVKFCSSTLS